MRLTKIVATLGPASSSELAISELVAAGVDVFRLNFSHGSHAVHRQTLDRVRAVAAASGRTVSVLQDLSGPKIRTGRLAGGRPVPLVEGSALRIATGDFEGGPGRVSTTYAELARAVGPGDRLVLDDGRLEVRVEASDGQEIVAMVVSGGDLGEHKGINAPGVRLPASSFTAKDLADLAFGLDCGVDFVALSFVQSAADLHRAREAMAGHGGPRIPLIAKIERPEAVADLEAVLDASDGVMVARGDLGLELPLERVPRIQKEIVRGAHARGIPVIVATQVFDSMRSEPMPTRAEVSDAANAVDDLVDAIMLSGETAVGRWPRRTVETLDAVIREAESMQVAAFAEVDARVIPLEHSRALCEAAVGLATRVQASAIVAVTRGGRTPRVLSALRPAVPILVATDDAPLARRLTLHRGVRPVVLPHGPHFGATLETVEDGLIASGWLPTGAVIVFVSIAPDLAVSNANLLGIRRLGERSSR